MLEKETVDNPKSIEAWRNYGSFLLSTGSPSEAEEKFLKALELGEDNLEIWIELGNSYMKQNKWKQAEKSFRTTVEKNLDYSTGWLNLGIVLARQGNMLDAEAAFDMYQYGTSADMSKEIKLAKEMAENAHIEENPEYAKRKENFAQITRQITGIMFGHLPEDDENQSIDPEIDAETLRLRAELLLTSGRIQDAFVAAEKAVEIDPKSREAWQTLAKCTMGVGLFIQAIQAYSKADSFLE